MPNQSEHRETVPTWLIGTAICYSAALILTIRSGSLWTDEAFSAYMAGQRTLGSFVSTLLAGDSSDLQMAVYYLYLHCWTAVFGSSEVALRAANVPFIVVFAFTFVWTSWRVFRSRWIWIAPALMPFLWTYAGEARAYFALVALGAVAFGCLLAWFERPSEKERRFLPWLVLGSLFLGSTFHMLMLLAVVPLLAIMFIYGRPLEGNFDWAAWKPALRAFALPFLSLMTYIGWTFFRGTAYDYARPGILSMGSIFYRLLGLTAFGPNRRYDIPFSPYLPAIIAASLVLLIALAGVMAVGLHTKNRVRLVSLFCAFLLAMLQVVALSVILQKQVDVRHLGAVVPLLMILLVAALSEPSGRKIFNLSRASALLLATLWACADFRLLFLPEYKEEDFRSAVNKAVAIYGQSKADIALVADPAGGGYYGLRLQGERPCFPWVDTCAEAEKKVAWIEKAPAVYALPWKKPQITAWLDARSRTATPVVVIISRGRHPSVLDSDWWPVLRSSPPSIQYSVQGFSIYFLEAPTIAK